MGEIFFDLMSEANLGCIRFLVGVYSSLISPSRYISVLTEQSIFQNGVTPMATSDRSSSSSTLTPCRYAFDCLDQYHPTRSSTHNQQYSHPCRYSELCRNIQDTPHCLQFTHTKHDVPKCRFDSDCSKITDPVHRFTYRHTNLPDLLMPCRNQQQCPNNDLEHRKKYSHGEKLDRNTRTVSSSGKQRIFQFDSRKSNEGGSMVTFLSKF